ncbi:MAG: hypothetical protein LIO94_04395 [Clostridiales bacterium]|nr:hypothetical protein [Clostridiales bacterium]
MKKKTTQLLLLLLFMTLGFFLKATPTQAAYVEVSGNQEKIKAGNYYFWIDLESESFMYAKTKKAAGKVLATEEEDSEYLLGYNFYTDGKTVFYLRFHYTGKSYIYKYSISKNKKTLLKETTDVMSFVGYYPTTKTLYMQKGSKLVGLNINTGKFTTILKNVYSIYGMNKTYVVYGKQASNGKISFYSYNMSSKKKTLIYKSDYSDCMVVANNRIYFLDCIKEGTEANDYYNTYVLKTCALSGGSLKTISGEMQGTSATFNGHTTKRLDFIIWNTGIGGDGTDGYYRYKFSTGKLSKLQ